MADQKISALTAASTPLAGTEVLPLVQSSTTKKVSIADVTAGRAVSMLSSTVGGGGTDGVSYWKRADGLTVNTEAVNSTDGAIDYTTAYGRQRFYNYTGLVLDIGGTDTNKGAVMAAGNLAFGTAAKGVNFTANTPAAGMTSQLLNWYEEGTFTPTIITTGTNFTSVTYSAATSARYTRIGNIVNIQLFLRTDAVTVGSASGNIRITGLPFTSIADPGGQSSLAVGRSQDWVVNQPSSATVAANSTIIDLFYRSVSNGATISLPFTDVDTGASKNRIQIAGTYICA